MKHRILRSNPVNAPLTTDQALWQGKASRGIEYERNNIMRCYKCGKGGTLKNIGTKQKPEYRHVGRCPSRRCL